MTSDLSQVTEDSARGGFFLFSGAALGSVILAVSAIIMGRFLGPELYGQYNLVLVIPTLLLLITDLGINAGITKFAASLRQKGKSSSIPGIIRHGLMLRLAVGVAVSAISLFFANYFSVIINRPDLTFYVQIASLSVIFQVVFTTTNSAFVGLDRSEYSALVTTVRAVLTTILQIALVLFSFGVVGALIGFVAGFAVSSIVAGILLFFKFLKPSERLAPSSSSQGRKQTLSLLAKFGMPVYLSVILTGLFPIFQQVVLAFFVSDIMIGNFRAAYNFVLVLGIISTSVTTALLPAFSKLELASPDVISSFFNKANKYTCLLIVPITVAAIVLANPIVEVLYGSGYTLAPIYLSLSCSVYLLSVFGYLTLASVFNGMGKTRLTLNMTLVNFFVLVVLSLILASMYGVIGALIAYLASAFAASVYGATLAIRQVGIKFSLGIIARIYVVSVLSAVPVVAFAALTSLNFGTTLLIGAFAYSLVFLTLMPLVGIVELKEVENIRRLTQSLPLASILGRPILAYMKRIILLKSQHWNS